MACGPTDFTAIVININKSQQALTSIIEGQIHAYGNSLVASVIFRALVFV